MPKHGFADMLLEIVRVDGKTDVEDRLNVSKVYSDSKIKIIGYLKQENGDWKFVRFHIALKIPSQVTQPHWGLERKPATDETVVYHGDVRYMDDGTPWLYDHFHRQGKWEVYVEQLAGDIQARREAARKLHSIPVNDNQLFPDI